MTIKEASKELQHSIDVGLCPNRESRRMGVRSLEAWEKVRDEVGRLSTNWEYGDGVMDCWNIINKHLSEVEGKE